MKLVLSTGILHNKPVAILPNNLDKFAKNSEHVDSAPQSTSDIGVQTDDYRKNKKPIKLLRLNCNSTKRRISKQTQTNNSLNKEKSCGKSMETQTLQVIKGPSKTRKCAERRDAPSKQSKHTLLAEDVNLNNNFTSANLFPTSPLPLRHDVGLQDFWEEKNTSSTQTLPEKDIFEAFNDNVTQTEFETLYEHSRNPLIQCVPKSSVALMTLPYVEDTSAVEGYSFTSTDSMSQADPILTAGKTFDDRFSSIETQTEQAFLPSYFYSESLSRSFALSSTIETQTTDNLDNMEELYSNTCTQTCNEILSSDLGLTDIQTQTWSHDIAVSTETQTKSLICDNDCNIPTVSCKSWMNTQTNHTETQTDLLSIFEEF